MNRQNREKLLIIVALISVGSLIGDQFVLTPLLNHWDEQIQEIALLENTLAKADLLLRRERDIRKRWLEMKRDALPATMSEAENLIFKAVDRWTEQSQINLISLKPQWRIQEETFNTLEFRLSAQGTIEQITRFLYELESDGLSLKIENAELISRDEQGQALLLELLFSGIQFREDET